MAEHPIGKRYDAGVFVVEAGAGERYAEATNDPNPAYQGGSTLTPPMFHVRGFIQLMMICATDPELNIDMMRLVHGEHGMVFHRALRVGDQVGLHGELLSINEKSSGTLFSFKLWGEVDGEMALEGTTSYFVRGPSKGGKRSPRREVQAPPPPSWSVEQPVAADQADRYAAVSGDHNPIHVDAHVAKAAGLRGVILHGLCTMAFAQRDLIARYAPEDPTRLASLSVRFAAPVYPGETLTLQVWEQEEGRIAFQTLNNNGKPVLTGGKAEFH